ncbi:hypothetical protein V2J09_000648 [Rumex salicifolius]
MALGLLSRNQKLPIFLFLFSTYSIIISTSSATVVVIGNNITLSFDDVAATFAPPVKSSGISGQLYLAEPLDACSKLTNKIQTSGNSSSPFALIVRGNCSFEDKVRGAQRAGFRAVIVHDNEDGGGLVARTSGGIKIPAIFVTKASGEKLSKYAVQENTVLWLIPSFENSAWSIMVISFISLLAMSAVLATCFFVRRHRIRRERPVQQSREFHGMSRRSVKAIPSLIFTAVTEEYCTSATCAICLEDYNVGEKIRVLPCKHKFHTSCVDLWLTSWRTFCPVCKKDARTSNGIPPACESTPLLSSASSSVASSPLSIQSSLRSSTSLQIASPQPRGSSSTLYHSFINSPHHHQQLPRIPVSLMTMSRSSLDLRNMSSQRSASNLIFPSPYSASSLGYQISPLNPRYMSPYNPSPSPSPSPSQRTSSYLGVGSTSATRPPDNPLHYSESASSFSPFVSAHSLPAAEYEV